MRPERTAALSPDQTEQQTRLTVLSACQELNTNGLVAAGLLSMGHRWKRSGATGLLTTSESPANSVESWHADSIKWRSLQPEPAQAEPWPGQPTTSVPGTDEPWLGLYRGLFNEFGATQVILLLSPPYASALACLPRVHSEGLPPIHPAVAAFGPSGVRCAPFVSTGTPELDQNALQAIMPALASSHACLLSNLGMLVMGQSVRQAVNRAKALEGLAQIYSLSLQLGEPTVLDAAETKLPNAGWQHTI